MSHLQSVLRHATDALRAASQVAATQRLHPDDLPRVLAAERRNREIVFGSVLAGSDAAWNMLLDLYYSGPAHVTSVCVASRHPATTGLRSLGLLERHGAVERKPKAGGGRRVLIGLTEAGSALLREHFACVAGQVVG